MNNWKSGDHVPGLDSKSCSYIIVFTHYCALRHGNLVTFPSHCFISLSCLVVKSISFVLLRSNLNNTYQVNCVHESAHLFCTFYEQFMSINVEK